MKHQLQVEELKGEIREYEDMLAEDSDLEAEIRPELDVLQIRLTSLEKEKVDPDDQKNTIVEIQAGVGGDESALFAADLYKMYEAYVKVKKLRMELLEAVPGNMGGFKSVMFSISGENAYGIFRNESGSARVQRVPSTETKGRIHTSIATVIVLPEVEIEHVDIDKADVTVDTYNSGGKGGQHCNKSTNAVKLTHVPTGITACSQLKSQMQNMKLAWKALATKIADTLAQQNATEASDKKRRLRGSGMRNERIRTYNFPQDRVTDHRIKKNYSLTTVLAGGLDKLFDDLKENLPDD
ncbi:PCRF domain-containing protein [Planctomycetota bacterium]|nr:PCRF domain-containing protein [Planctomycetota bacterium]